MKKLILLAFTLITNIFAGELQDLVCRDKSLLQCINNLDRQCEAKNYFACGVVEILRKEQKQYNETKKDYEKVLQDLEKDCNLGNTESCLLAGGLYSLAGILYLLEGFAPKEQ